MDATDIEEISSGDVVYSEHDIDECFEYRDGSGRVADGVAVGVIMGGALILLGDIKYSLADHNYWDNYELEFDERRLVLPQWP